MVDTDLKSSNTLNLETNATDLTLSISGIFTASSATATATNTSPPRRKTVDEVWGEIVAKTAKKELKVEPNEDNNELMTLEDFLAKADAKVEEREIVKVERLWSDVGVYGSGIVSERSGVEEGRRGKRRVESLDKVVMQRQRRMIKNRESAARSRERKQAYQVELESMVMKLEEENELLLKEKVLLQLCCYSLN
ncbi:hypothetical protein AgCh_026219 [Apium graveolens]